MQSFIQSLNSVKQVSLSLLNIIKLDILWINSESTAQYTACHLIMKTNVENCLIYCNFRAKSYKKNQSLIPDSDRKQHTVPQIFEQHPSSLSLPLQQNR